MSKLLKRSKLRIILPLLVVASLSIVPFLHRELWAEKQQDEQEQEEGEIREYFQYRFDQMKDKTGRIPDGTLINALNQRKAMAQQRLSRGPLAPTIAGIDNTSWTYAGPDNVGGRIRAILPISASTVFVGGVSGGIWKTTNCFSTITTRSPTDYFMANQPVSKTRET